MLAPVPRKSGSLRRDFFHAVKKNDRAPLVRSIIESGAVSPNDVDEHGTPALVAAIDAAMERGKDAMVAAVLLELGAYPNAHNARGKPVVVMATECLRPDIVELLLNAGAAADATYTYIATNRSVIETNAVCFAARGRRKCLRLLLKYGADIDMRDSLTITPLCWATGHPECVRILIEHGADVSAKTRSGMTAATFAAKEGEDESLEILLTHGVPFSDDLADRAKDKATLRVLYDFVRGQLPAQRRADIACEFLLDYRADFPPEIADLCSQFVSARL